MKEFRKHIRSQGYDYSTPNYYFVTICTKDREEFFEPRVSKRYGHALPDFVTGVAATHASPGVNVKETKRTTDVVERCLLDIPEHFSNTEIDFYIFMSDHTHLILVITDTGGACPAATKRPSLGSIIGSFKAAASRLVGKSLWQPNYYEHIIRSESCLDRIRDYILRNPCMEYDEINWRLLDPSL